MRTPVLAVRSYGMKKIVSLAWLRIERAPDLIADLTPGLLLVLGGLLVLVVAAAQ